MMKKWSVKLTAVMLSAALILIPQTAFAGSPAKDTAPDAGILQEKVLRWEAAATRYLYDDAAPKAQPVRTESRFIKQDGIYVNPDAETSNRATLMITGDLMCQWRQQEAAFTGSGKDYLTYEEMQTVIAKVRQEYNAALEQALEVQPEITEAAVSESEPEPSEAIPEAVSTAISSFTMPVLNYGLIPQPEGEWNFDESFQYVREILKKGDLVIGNLETMLSQSSPLTMQMRILESRPYLNSPVAFLESLKYAGYDMLTLANNHCCDTGVRGVLETIENIDAYNFMRTGMFSGEDDDRWMIADVNGIKIGFAAYATYFNTKDANFTEAGQDTLLNRFSYSRARSDIRAMKKKGAEYVIIFMHWGRENTHEISDNQQRYAAQAAKAGADYIVGSHPHALQPYEIIETADGRQVPVIYSMGNFLSCMTADVNNDTQILQLDLAKSADGSVSVTSHRLYPCTILVDAEIKDSSGIVRTDSYVIVPQTESLRSGLVMDSSSLSISAREDTAYMKSSLSRFMAVYENKTILDVPYDPYLLNRNLQEEDSLIRLQDILLGRFRWIMANQM